MESDNSFILESRGLNDDSDYELISELESQTSYHVIDPQVQEIWDRLNSRNPIIRLYNKIQFWWDMKNQKRRVNAYWDLTHPAHD